MRSIRSVPRRHPLVVCAACIAAALSGPLLGMLVSSWVAPDSDLAEFAAFGAFAMAFVSGLNMWLGVALATAIASTLFRLLRGQWRRVEPVPPSREPVPNGYAVFVPIGALYGLAAGVVAAIASDVASLAFAALAQTAAGTAYGVALYALAHTGYLPFPEPA
jgi:hypothetical protein